MPNIKSNNLIVFYFTLALPITFLIGSMFVNIIAVTISLYTLIWIFKFKKYSIFFNKPYNYLFLLFILFIISSIFSKYKLTAFENSFFYLSSILLFISLNLFIFSNHERLLLISKLVLILVIFICIDLWFQRIIGVNLIGYPTQQASRLTSFFGDEQIPGSFIFKLSPFVIYYLFNQKKNKHLISFRTTILMFIYFSILITGERAASILSTIVILLLLILNFKDINKNKALKYLLLFSIILFTLFSFKNSVIKERFYYTFEQAHNNVYISYYSNSLDILQKNIFWGTGPQTYRYECQNVSNICSTHPHNFAFELLSDTGIFSLIIFIIALYSVIINKFKTIKNKFNRSIILIFTLLFFFPLIPTGSFFTSFHMTLTWFSLGFIYSIKDKYID